MSMKSRPQNVSLVFGHVKPQMLITLVGVKTGRQARKMSTGSSNITTTDKKKESDVAGGVKGISGGDIGGMSAISGVTSGSQGVGVGAGDLSSGERIGTAGATITDTDTNPGA